MRLREPFSGQAKAEDGVLVQVICGAQRRTLHRSGMRTLDALREIVRQIEEWPGEWKVEVISTPTTIYRDLQGTRRQGNQPGHGLGETELRLPESDMLGRIGRLDLLASRGHGQRNHRDDHRSPGRNGTDPA